MSTMELAAASDSTRLQAGLLGPCPLAAGSRLQEFEISAVIGQGGFIPGALSPQDQGQLSRL